MEPVDFMGSFAEADSTIVIRQRHILFSAHGGMNEFRVLATTRNPQRAEEQPALGGIQAQEPFGDKSFRQVAFRVFSCGNKDIQTFLLSSCTLRRLAATIRARIQVKMKTRRHR